MRVFLISGCTIFFLLASSIYILNTAAVSESTASVVMLWSDIFSLGCRFPRILCYGSLTSSLDFLDILDGKLLSSPETSWWSNFSSFWRKTSAWSLSLPSSSSSSKRSWRDLFSGSHIICLPCTSYFTSSYSVSLTILVFNAPQKMLCSFSELVHNMVVLIFISWPPTCRLGWFLALLLEEPPLLPTLLSWRHCGFDALLEFWFTLPMSFCGRLSRYLFNYIDYSLE